MAYEKTTWATGDTITAEKLNKIEDGINNNSNSKYFEIDGTTHYDIEESQTIALNKTYSEILSVIQNGKLPIIFNTITDDNFPNDIKTEILFFSRFIYDYDNNNNIIGIRFSSPMGFTTDANNTTAVFGSLSINNDDEIEYNSITWTGQKH